MEEILKKLLNNEVFNDETRKAVGEAFKLALEEAKVEQEKSLRADMAERFEQEKKQIHAALEQFLGLFFEFVVSFVQLTGYIRFRYLDVKRLFY